MLTLKVKGEEHPKTFVLVTDDAEGELDRISEIYDEVEMPKGHDDRAWFDNASADQFKEGVEIPKDEAPDFTELLEGDWPEAYEVFERERRDAVEKAEAALGQDDD